GAGDADLRLDPVIVAHPDGAQHAARDGGAQTVGDLAAAGLDVGGREGGGGGGGGSGGVGGHGPGLRAAAGPAQRGGDGGRGAGLGVGGREGGVGGGGVSGVVGSHGPSLRPAAGPAQHGGDGGSQGCPGPRGPSASHENSVARVRTWTRDPASSKGCASPPLERPRATAPSPRAPPTDRRRSRLTGGSPCPPAGGPHAPSPRASAPP